MNGLTQEQRNSIVNELNNYYMELFDNSKLDTFQDPVGCYKKMCEKFNPENSALKFKINSKSKIDWGQSRPNGGRIMGAKPAEWRSHYGGQSRPNGGRTKGPRR